MVIYGVGLLALCFLAGQFAGESLGVLLGIEANVGGVGFSMILLMLSTDWLQKKRLFTCTYRAGYPILEFNVYTYHRSYVSHPKCFCCFFTRIYGSFSRHYTYYIPLSVHTGSN